MILGPLFLPGARPPPDPLRPQGLSDFLAKVPARAALLMQGFRARATAGREEGLPQSPPQRPRCSRRIAFTPAAMPPVPMPPPSFARRLPSAVSSVSSSPPSPPPLRRLFVALSPWLASPNPSKLWHFAREWQVGGPKTSKKPCFARFSQRGGRFPRQLARMPPRHSPCPLARRLAPPRTPPGKKGGWLPVSRLYSHPFF